MSRFSEIFRMSNNLKYHLDKLCEGIFYGFDADSTFVESQAHAKGSVTKAKIALRYLRGKFDTAKEVLPEARRDKYNLANYALSRLEESFRDDKKNLDISDLKIYFSFLEFQLERFAKP